MGAPRTRDESVALIAEHLGCDSGTPARRAAALDVPFRRLGWGMLTDEAVAVMAERFVRDTDEADRLAARARRLAEEGAAERALRNRQRETGDLLAEAFPIKPHQDAA